MHSLDMDFFAHPERILCSTLIVHAIRTTTPAAIEEMKAPQDDDCRRLQFTAAIPNLQVPRLCGILLREISRSPRLCCHERHVPAWHACAILASPRIPRPHVLSSSISTQLVLPTIPLHPRRLHQHLRVSRALHYLPSLVSRESSDPIALYRFRSHKLKARARFISLSAGLRPLVFTFKLDDYAPHSYPVPVWTIMGRESHSRVSSGHILSVLTSTDLFVVLNSLHGT